MVNQPVSFSQLIDRAIAGESDAIQHILHYLNAANQDLRRMMQSELHQTYKPVLWEQLLFCIAHECWQTGIPGDPQAAQASLPVQARGIQSIIEAYTIDTSDNPDVEREVKLSVLLPTIEDPDFLLRFAAGYILGLRGNLRSLPVLDEILSTTRQYNAQMSNDQVVSWQLRAVQALSTLNDTTCGPLLIKALARHERTVHYAAGRALSDLGRNAEPALLNALHHPDAHIRWHAARALGQIGDLRAVDTLAEGLMDENQEVRWTTARVLANLDAPAIPGILKILASQPVNEPLRQSAYHALNGMMGLHHAEIANYLKPLLDELRRPSAAATLSPELPMIARRLLLDWKNVSSSYTPPPGREARSTQFS